MSSLELYPIVYTPICVGMFLIHLATKYWSEYMRPVWSFTLIFLGIMIVYVASMIIPIKINAWLNKRYNYKGD